MANDFIALVVGSYGEFCYGRDTTPEKAAKVCASIAKSDFKLKKGFVLKTNIFDVTGNDDVFIDYRGCWEQKNGNVGKAIPLTKTLELTI